MKRQDIKIPEYCPWGYGTPRFAHYRGSENEQLIHELMDAERENHELEKKLWKEYKTRTRRRWWQF